MKKVKLELTLPQANALLAAANEGEQDMAARNAEMEDDKPVVLGRAIQALADAINKVEGK